MASWFNLKQFLPLRDLRKLIYSKLTHTDYKIAHLVHFANREVIKFNHNDVFNISETYDSDEQCRKWIDFMIKETNSGFITDRYRIFLVAAMANGNKRLLQIVESYSKPEWGNRDLFIGELRSLEFWYWAIANNRGRPTAVQYYLNYDALYPHLSKLKDSCPNLHMPDEIQYYQLTRAVNELNDRFLQYIFITNKLHRSSESLLRAIELVKVRDMLLRGHSMPPLKGPLCESMIVALVEFCVERNLLKALVEVLARLKLEEQMTTLNLPFNFFGSGAHRLIKEAGHVIYFRLTTVQCSLNWDAVKEYLNELLIIGDFYSTDLCYLFRTQDFEFQKQLISYLDLIPVGKWHKYVEMLTMLESMDQLTFGYCLDHYPALIAKVFNQCPSMPTWMISLALIHQVPEIDVVNLMAIAIGEGYYDKMYLILPHLTAEDKKRVVLQLKAMPTDPEALELRMLNAHLFDLKLGVLPWMKRHGFTLDV